MALAMTRPFSTRLNHKIMKRDAQAHMKVGDCARRCNTLASSFARPPARAQSLAATWVGHSTMLVQIAGVNLLTDPVWADRASPVRFAGPRRHVRPAFAIDALPPLDIVLISHNHYDHLDDGTVRALVARHPEAAWAVPLRVAEFVRVRGARHVVELDWWQRTSIGAIELTCTPAQHFSARGIGDRNRTLWAS